MDDLRDHLAVPTLLSLWSAMLGGAAGGALGNIGSSILCGGIIGVSVGAAASVLIHMLFYSVLYVLSNFVFKRDFGEVAIGGYKGDYLACIMGGIAGLCSASLVRLVLPAHDIHAFRTFTICWSTAAFVPLVITLALVWRNQH